MACASTSVRLAKRSFGSGWIFRRFGGFVLASSSRKRSISRSFKMIFIAILSSALAAFRIDNLEVGELFFSANNLIISPPRFSIEISEVVSQTP